LSKTIVTSSTTDGESKMKLRIPPAVLDEMTPAMEDAQRPNSDPTSKTYLKILAAEDTATRLGATIDADDDDIAEIKSRADYVLTSIVPDNLDWSSDPEDKRFYRRMRDGYRSLVKQLSR